jgi:hypothetical protein
MDLNIDMSKSIFTIIALAAILSMSVLHTLLSLQKQDLHRDILLRPVILVIVVVAAAEILKVMIPNPKTRSTPTIMTTAATQTKKTNAMIVMAEAMSAMAIQEDYMLHVYVILTIMMINNKIIVVAIPTQTLRKSIIEQ